MRNLRKTRKKGGFEYVPNIYNCGTKLVRGKTAKIQTTECIKNFTDLNNFMLVEVLDDGNCFYDTLSKYGKRANNPILNKPHMDLRREIIGTMIENKHEYEPFFAANNNNNNNNESLNIEGELRRFLKSGQWAGWLGDIVPQVAADILGINIVLYDLIIREDENHIDMIKFTSRVPSDTTVNMLRTNGSHFRLLWPRNAPVIPKGVQAIPKVKEILKEIPKEVPIVPISRPIRLATIKKSKAESPTRLKSVSRNRTSSLENALIQISLQEEKEKKEKKEKKTNNYLNNNNFYKALEEAGIF